MRIRKGSRGAPWTSSDWWSQMSKAQRQNARAEYEAELAAPGVAPICVDASASGAGSSTDLPDASGQGGPPAVPAAPAARCAGGWSGA